VPSPVDPDTAGPDAELLTELRRRVRGDVRSGVAMAELTTLKVGGPASAVVRAEGCADLVAVAEVCAAAQRPVLVVGRGSNLLVADTGWPGVAVVLGRGFRGVVVDQIDEEVDGVGAVVGVVAGAAEPMPVLARTVAGRGLGGLAFGVAIPGTLGGAVRMNAGAHGGEIAQVLEWAEVVRLGRAGAVERLGLDDLAARYRHTALPDDAVVVRARLRLRRTDPATLASEMAEMKQWRRAHQPINEPSCGSVFRNPPGDSAGRLIEAAGLKGYRIGGAQISPRHANFITTGASVSAADVHALISHMRAEVARIHGVHLQTEVVLVGFDVEGPAATGARQARP
jgi:UDP-N-acetylmuramate dehydrogenase